MVSNFGNYLLEFQGPDVLQSFVVSLEILNQKLNIPLRNFLSLSQFKCKIEEAGLTTNSNYSLVIKTEFRSLDEIGNFVKFWSSGKAFCDIPLDLM